MILSEHEQIRDRWLPYYTVIGELVSCWNRVESGRSILFKFLLGGDWKEAHAIFHGSRSSRQQAVDIGNAITKSTIQSDQKIAVAEQIERIGKLAIKRNHIIHGQWVMIGYRNDNPEDFVAVRLADIEDYDVWSKVIEWANTRHPQHQSEVHRYLHTVEQITATIADIRQATDDLFALMRPLFPQQSAVTEPPK